MATDLLLGFLFALPVIQIFKQKSWVICSVVVLIYTTVALSLIFEIHPIPVSVVILSLLLNCSLLLNTQLKFGDLLSLNALLLILIMAAYLSESTTVILLTLWNLMYLITATLKNQNWLNWLLVLILNLTWLLVGNSGLWLISCWLVACFVLWQISQAKHFEITDTNAEQLFEQIEAAKTQERSRIYQNIHDDVGAELLKLIYQLSDNDAKDQVKNIMNKLRQAVANTAHITTSTESLLHEISAEAHSRCATLGIKFTDEITLKSNPSLNLTKPIHLQRYIRELVSNCLKHAEAKNLKLTAEVTDSAIGISLKDDGKGISPDNLHGKGMVSLSKRIKAEGGQINWQNNPDGGTVIHITYPL
jgi:signal transduction histidine kinase